MKQPERLVPDSRKNALIFIIKAVIFSSVLMGIYLFIPSGFWIPVQEINARISGTLLSLFGIPIIITGSIVQSNRYSVQVIDQCLAIDVTLLLIAFILAFPSTMRQKLYALACGVPAVLGANILRIIFVFLIGSAKPEYFDLAHLYFGQIFMIVLLSSLFIIWILTMTKNGVVKNNALFLLKLFGYSGILFITWSLIHKPFVQYTEVFLKSITRAVTGMNNPSFQMHRMYEYTFNFVTFTSLVLASDIILWRRKIISLVAGNAVLFIFQLLFRIVGIYAAGLKSYAAYKVSIGIFEVASFLFPLILWILVRYWHNMLITCPVCGVHKTGIEEHIRNKHGEDALLRDDVTHMFRMVNERKKGRFTD